MYLLARWEYPEFKFPLWNSSFGLDEDRCKDSGGNDDDRRSSSLSSSLSQMARFKMAKLNARAQNFMPCIRK